MGLKISIRRELVNLTFPIFVETLLIMLLGAVDTFMLSHYSDNTVAAVGLVNQLLMFVFLIFEVTTQGTSVFCSQYIGAGQKKNMLQVVGVSLLFNGCVGIAISSFLYFKGTALLELMNLRPELMPDGETYMRIVGGFAFTQSVSFTLSAILRSANKAYYPMLITLLVNVLNFFGNYALIFGKFGFPEMGVEGAAISTSFSRCVAMGLLFIILFRKVIRRLPLWYFRPFPWDKLKNVLRIGIPSAGEQVSYSGSQVVITYFINMLGNEALAARTYVMNTIMFSFLFAIAIGLGGAISIGHLIGQGKKQAAFTLGRYCRKLAIIITVCLAFVTALFGRNIMELLTSNPEIIRMGTTILWIEVLLEIGRPSNIFAVNALRATGDAVYPFVVGLIVMWSVAVGLSYVFGIVLGWGLAGMWVAFTLDENIRGVILSRRWFSKKWEKYNFIRR